jgi:hypothetical protein
MIVRRPCGSHVAQRKQAASALGAVVEGDIFRISRSSMDQPRRDSAGVPTQQIGEPAPVQPASLQEIMAPILNTSDEWPQGDLKSRKLQPSRVAKVTLFAAVALGICATAGAVLYVLQAQEWQIGSSLFRAIFGRAPTPGVASNSADRATADPYVIFAGDGAAFATPPGNTKQAAGNQREKIILLRSTVRQAQLAPSINTANLSIPTKLVKELSGQRVLITVWARRPATEGKSPFAIGYAAGSAGNTGWFVFDATSEMTPFRFAYRMPAQIEAGFDEHRLAIWSAIDGSGNALEVKLVTIKVAN